MIRRPIQVPLYGVLVVCLVAALGPLGSMFASIAIANNNAAKQQRERDAEAARIAAASRATVCAWFSAWLDTWDEAPPTTEAGKKVRVKTLELYELSKCQPIRK